MTVVSGDTISVAAPDDVRTSFPAGTALSPRELEVLERASRGFTNGQIAVQMNVTVHAVKWHLGSIYRKLGVHNRTEAAIAYLKAMSGTALSGSEG